MQKHQQMTGASDLLEKAWDMRAPEGKWVFTVPNASLPGLIRTHQELVRWI